MDEATAASTAAKQEQPELQLQAGNDSSKEGTTHEFGVNTATTNYAPCVAVHEKNATCIQKNYDCGHDIAKSIRTGQLCLLYTSPSPRD